MLRSEGEQRNNELALKCIFLETNRYGCIDGYHSCLRRTVDSSSLNAECGPSYCVGPSVFRFASDLVALPNWIRAPPYIFRPFRQ